MSSFSPSDNASSLGAACIRTSGADEIDSVGISIPATKAGSRLVGIGGRGEGAAIGGGGLVQGEGLPPVGHFLQALLHQKVVLWEQGLWEQGYSQLAFGSPGVGLLEEQLVPPPFAVLAFGPEPLLLVGPVPLLLVGPVLAFGPEPLLLVGLQPFEQLLGQFLLGFGLQHYQLL